VPRRARHRSDEFSRAAAMMMRRRLLRCLFPQSAPAHRDTAAGLLRARLTQVKAIARRTQMM
jgi:hypothetical protein